MRKSERVIVYASLTILLLIGLRPTLAPSIAAAADGDGSVPSIAVCSVGAIIDEMMETDRFLPERLEFEQDLREQLLGDTTGRIEELEREVEGMDRDSEEFARARDEYFRLQGEANRLQQEVRRQVEARVAQQLTEIRLEVIASARAVAEDLGFDYVISSESDETAYESESVRDLVIDFLARPVLMHPEAADISEDVREDLKLG